MYPSENTRGTVPGARSKPQPHMRRVAPESADVRIFVKKGGVRAGRRRRVSDTLEVASRAQPAAALDLAHDRAEYRAVHRSLRWLGATCRPFFTPWAVREVGHGGQSARHVSDVLHARRRATDERVPERKP